MLATTVRMSQIEGGIPIPPIEEGIPSYYVMAQDSDFDGTANGKFQYIGSHEYVIIPHVIKGRSITSYINMFKDNASTTLKGVASDNPNITDASWMFWNCQATTLDLSNFDTSNITNMTCMFDSSRATNIIGLNNFNTSKATLMGGMFRSSRATTLDLSNFNTSKVSEMDRMFYDSRATILDLSSFNPVKVVKSQHRAYMFQYASATTGYARTQANADWFNATSGKPAGLIFVVKEEI